MTNNPFDKALTFLLSPGGMVFGILIILEAIHMLRTRKDTMSPTQRTITTVIMVIAVVYILFIVWLAGMFG